MCINKSEVDEQQDFVIWLQKNYGCSRKVAKDYLSRCKRVEKEFNIVLSDVVSSPQLYELLVKNIHSYANSIFIKNRSIKKRSVYTLTATLKLAIKRYAEYKKQATM